MTTRFFARCPFCEVPIELKERKDWESFTLGEVGAHVRDEHPNEDPDYIPFPKIEMEGEGQ